MGTLVAHGRGSGLVVQTGMRTELGRIAGMLQDIETVRTPLQRKLAQVGKHLSLAGLGAALLLLGIGLLRGEAFTVLLLTSVSLLVAVVPEGLPAVITATLALGARRMLKRHALIRKLPAVETLGSVTVICSDKTGTLTENRMTVTRLRTLHADLRLAEEAASLPRALTAAEEPELAPLLLAGALCNDAHLVFEEAGRPPQRIGDPTETALLAAAEHFGIATQPLGDELPRLAEFAFDSDRKRMATLHRADAGDYPLPAVLAAPVLAAVKGAPDGLLALATRVLDQGRIVPMTADLRRGSWRTTNRWPATASASWPARSAASPRRRPPARGRPTSRPTSSSADWPACWTRRGRRCARPSPAATPPASAPS
jgi:P-type Ca2+ transporter type 2C